MFVRLFEMDFSDRIVSKLKIDFKYSILLSFLIKVK